MGNPGLQVRAYTPSAGWERAKWRKHDIPTGEVVRWTIPLGQRFPGATYFRYRFQAVRQVGQAKDLVAADWIEGPTVGGMKGVLALSSLTAQPTPIGAQVTFSLSAPGAVQARVLNLAGRPVKTLCVAAPCEAGTNTLVWNAQTDGGLRVPNGAYVVEVLARTDDGSQARGLTQVRVR